MAQLTWNDIFDFSSLDEPSAATPPPPSDPTQHDICCDYACCGLSLPDLHALVDHFEEHHVLVLGQDGRPTCSPLILSYPQPDPPAEPSSLFGASSPFASTTHGHLYPTLDGLEHDFSDGTSDSASSSSTLPSPNPSEPMCLPPSLLTVHPPLPPDVLTPRDAAIGRHKDQRPTHPKSAPAPAKHRASKAKAQLLGTGPHPNIQPVPHAETQKKRRSREREKAYKCPRPGCSKAYLNPNGLKYHLEKGTCTIVTQPEPAQDPPPAGNAH